MNTKNKKVIVIGAGVAGLATATLLARDGYPVTLIDKLPEAGGRAGTYETPEAPGFRWDTGPSWYLMPEAFDHFFRLCGTTTQQAYDLVDLEPAYRLYPENREKVDLSTGVDKVADLYESIEPGAGARIREYLDEASDSYQIALDYFLYTTFKDLRPIMGQKDVQDRLGNLAGLLTKDLESKVSALFKDVRLKQVLQYPAVFLSSQPAKTPALYSLMSHTDLVEGVRYPMGGFDAVVKAVEKLAKEAGVVFKLGAEATAIRTTFDENRTSKKGALTSVAAKVSRALPTKKADVTGVTVRNLDGTVEQLDANIVVSAADLNHTENKLLPPELRTYPESYWAKRDPGLGTVLLFLGVKGELPQLLHHTLLFSEDWTADFRAVYEGPEASRPLGHSHSIYISKPSATDPNVAPEGHENLFVLVPVPASESFGHGNAYREDESPAVSSIADATIAQIAQWAGIPDLAERIVVRKTLGPEDFADRYHAWSAGSIGPAHTLKQSAFFRGKNESKYIANLYYAGATTVPGVGVPMCLISAENVLKRINGDTTPGPSPYTEG